MRSNTFKNIFLFKDIYGYLLTHSEILRLLVVGEVESAVEVGLVHAERLRQSVLRSAFEGRL